jgi:hypothetical protein
MSVLGRLQTVGSAAVVSACVGGGVAGAKVGGGVAGVAPSSPGGRVAGARVGGGVAGMAPSSPGGTVGAGVGGGVAGVTVAPSSTGDGVGGSTRAGGKVRLFFPLFLPEDELLFLPEDELLFLPEDELLFLPEDDDDDESIRRRPFWPPLRRAEVVTSGTTHFFTLTHFLASTLVASAEAERVTNKTARIAE